jgi:hypothetical protein
VGRSAKMYHKSKCALFSRYETCVKSVLQYLHSKQASTSCGGKGISDPEGSSGGTGGSTSGDLLGEYPTHVDGTIECSASRSDGAGTKNTRDCLFTPGS